MSTDTEPLLLDPPQHTGFSRQKTHNQSGHTFKSSGSGNPLMAGSSCFFCVCVDQATIGIREQWGRYTGMLEPGCHFVNPCFGQRVAGFISLRIQELNVRVETKTRDNVFVNIVCSVQYRAITEQADDAFYKLTNPQQQITAYVFDVVRASVPRQDLDDVFAQKDEIARHVKEELEKVMGVFGFDMQNVLITDIEPDPIVKRSMNEINAASRLRVAALEKAEAEKITLVKRAEADAEAKYLSGQGIARQRQAIVDGLRESVVAFSTNVHGTTTKDVLDLVLVTQYFDTMKEIGTSSRNSTIFIPHTPGAVGDIAGQVRMGFLQGNIPQQMDLASKSK